MTLIVNAGRRYYSDSKVMTDGHFYYSLDKINGFRRPFEIICKKRKIKDTVYGYSYTGAKDQVVAFLKVLRDEGSVEMVELMYGIVDKCKMINDANHFEVILIGEKKDYSFNVGLNSEFVREYPRTKDGVINWTMGSGASFLRGLNDKYEALDPVRGMQATYTLDGGCGGMTDVWEMFEKPFPHFRRIGIHNRINIDNSEHFADIVTKSNMSLPIPMDLIVNPEIEVKRPKKQLSKVSLMRKLERRAAKLVKMRIIENENNKKGVNHGEQEHSGTAARQRSGRSRGKKAS